MYQNKEEDLAYYLDRITPTRSISVFVNVMVKGCYCRLYDYVTLQMK